MEIVGFIFARGGSKGLPGKNIRDFGGRPLIAWSIEQAKASGYINRVIVSTDSEEIAKVACQNGAEVPFLRPAELSKDDSREWLAWQHALQFLHQSEGVMPDVMVSVPTTSPLRDVKDIKNCINKFQDNEADVVITVTDAHRNPYFNMVKDIGGGNVGLVIQPATAIFNRQNAPKVYDMTTVCYVARSSFIMSHKSLFEGRVAAVHVDPLTAIDIDTLFDFRIAEAFLKLREFKNELD